MFGFPKKKEIAPSAPRTPGFLMTDFERKNGRPPVMDDLVRIAMRVPLPKPVVWNGDGTLSAMDSAVGQDSSIQEVKFLNSGSQGISPPLPQLEWYAAQTFIGYQICAIISQQWLVNKALLMPAEDATRNGYALTTNDGTKLDPEITDFIRERDEDFKTDLHLVDQLYSGRLFGIRVAMYMVDSTDKEYYEKPFNPDGIRPGSYKGIVQIDPYWIMPLLDMPSAANPASKHFYEPTWWMINGKRVHRSHLCIMRNGGTLPDILKPTYFYGGLPIPQLIAERVFASERTANEAPMLALSKRMTIYKADLTEAAGNPNALERKISKWSEFMNNFGIKLIGGDEEVTQHDLSLADLDAVIMTQYQLVAACASTPSTELLGTSPKGFSATGEFEAKSYTKFLKTCQKHHLTPLLRGHYQRLVKSEVLPRFKKLPYFTVSWNSTDSPTAKEQAEVNLLKAQTDAALVQAGAIDGYDSRQRIIADPDSGYNGIADIVPGGPGDREAQMEAEEPLESPVSAKGSVRESTGGDVDDMAENPENAGVAYWDEDGRVLLMRRAKGKTNGGTWAYPAGAVEAGETAEEAARREFHEETGQKFTGELRPKKYGQSFALFTAVGKNFVPVMNDEHTGYVWASPDDLPQPLHPGIGRSEFEE